MMVVRETLRDLPYHLLLEDNKNSSNYKTDNNSFIGMAIRGVIIKQDKI